MTDTYTKKAKTQIKDNVLKLNNMRKDFGIDELYFAQHRHRIAIDSKKSL